MKEAILLSMMFTLGLLGLLAEDKPKVDPNERTYQAAFDDIWKACVETANENYSVSYTDKQSGILQFETGSSIKSTPFRVGVTVLQIEGEKVRVKLSLQQKAGIFGFGTKGRIAKKFFKELEKKL